MKKIYLDVCVLSRPFDDQNYLRIQMETIALNLILSYVKVGKYKMLVSPVHFKEIEAISDDFERLELQIILESYGNGIQGDKETIRKIAEKYYQKGFGVADAAHVAYAEYAGADFISCDDKLIKKCIRNKVKIWCGNPITFCEKEGLK